MCVLVAHEVDVNWPGRPAAACSVCLPFWINMCTSDRTADAMKTRPDKMTLTAVCWRGNLTRRNFTTKRKEEGAGPLSIG